VLVELVGLHEADGDHEEHDELEHDVQQGGQVGVGLDRVNRRAVAHGKSSGDCRLPIFDCRWKERASQSAIENRQSAIAFAHATGLTAVPAAWVLTEEALAAAVLGTTVSGADGGRLELWYICVNRSSARLVASMWMRTSRLRKKAWQKMAGIDRPMPS